MATEQNSGQGTARKFWVYVCPTCDWYRAEEIDEPCHACMDGIPVPVVVWARDDVLAAVDVPARGRGEWRDGYAAARFEIQRRLEHVFGEAES